MLWFPRDMTERWPELDRLADLGMRILEKPANSSTHWFFLSAPTTTNAPLMYATRTEGINL